MLEAMIHLGKCFEPANGTTPRCRFASAVQRRSVRDHVVSMITRHDSEERHCRVAPPDLLDGSLLSEGPLDRSFRRAGGRRSRATCLALDIRGRFRCRR